MSSISKSRYITHVTVCPWQLWLIQFSCCSSDSEKLGACSPHSTKFMTDGQMRPRKIVSSFCSVSLPEYYHIFHCWSTCCKDSTLIQNRSKKLDQKYSQRNTSLRETGFLHFPLPFLPKAQLQYFIPFYMYSSFSASFRHHLCFN